MTNFLKKLAALINVKTLVTFAVTAVFVILSLERFFNAETVMSVVVMVIGFYFGTQHEAKNAANGAVSGNATPGAITPPPSEKGANADNELKGLIENGQIYIKE